MLIFETYRGLRPFMTLTACVVAKRNTVAGQIVNEPIGRLWPHVCVRLVFKEDLSPRSFSNSMWLRVVSSTYKITLL